MISNLQINLIGVFLLLGGCASITGSRNQPISVTSTHIGKPLTGSYCKLRNDKGAWHLTTPGSVVIQKAYGDLAVNCQKEEYSGSGIFKSQAEGATWGNIVAGGLIGYAVDASSGAGFSYPSTMNIDLIKNSEAENKK